MKKTIILIVIASLFISALTISCGGGNSPSGVVKVYYKESNAGNLEGVTKCFALDAFMYPTEGIVKEMTGI